MIGMSQLTARVYAPAETIEAVVEEFAVVEHPDNQCAEVEIGEVPDIFQFLSNNDLESEHIDLSW